MSATERAPPLPTFDSRGCQRMQSSMSKSSSMDFELMPITDDSMRFMQRSALQHLRPLEPTPPSSGISVPAMRGASETGLVANMNVLTFNGGQHTGMSTAQTPSNHNTKPAISFACLIGMAIMDSPNQRLTVSEVYEWIKMEFPYFGSVEAGTGWKNSVRHNLSLNKHFIKQVRSEPEASGKGSYWCIRPESLPVMEAAIRKQHNGARMCGTGGTAQSAEQHTQAGFAGATPRRPTAPRVTRLTLRPAHNFELRETGHAAMPTPQSPTSTDPAREAASLLFSMTGSATDSPVAAQQPFARPAAPTLPNPKTTTGNTARTQHFPTLSPHRAWSATRITSFPASATSTRPKSTIKATYTPNVYKSTGTTPALSASGSRQHAQQSARIRAGSTTSLTTKMPPMNGDSSDDPGSQVVDDMEITQCTEEERYGRRSAKETNVMLSPEQQQQPQQKLFTFQAPMSVQGFDARFTPEVGNGGRGRSAGIDSSKGHGLPGSSPTATRRRLAPIASPHEEDSMDCDDGDDGNDEENGAVAALLGLAAG